MRREEVSLTEEENLEQVLKRELVFTRQRGWREQRHGSGVGWGLCRLGGGSVSLGTRLCWRGT